MKILITLLVLLSTSLAYAVNPSATGYDWIKYEKSEKIELVKTLYYVLQVDTSKYPAERGVLAIDGLYWAWLKDHIKNTYSDSFENIFGKYVITHLVEILT